MAFGNPAGNAFNWSHVLHQASPAQFDDQGNQLPQWTPSPQAANMLGRFGNLGALAAPQQQAPPSNLGLPVIGNPSPANIRDRSGIGNPSPANTLNQSRIHPGNAALLSQLIQQQTMLAQPAQQRGYTPGLLAT